MWYCLHNFPIVEVKFYENLSEVPEDKNWHCSNEKNKVLLRATEKATEFKQELIKQRKQINYQISALNKFVPILPDL